MTYIPKEFFDVYDEEGFLMGQTLGRSFDGVVYADNGMTGEAGGAFIDEGSGKTERFLKKSKTQHRTRRPQRLGGDAGMEERIFFEEWQQKNKRGSWINHGFSALELLFWPRKYHYGTPTGAPKVSNRDAFVAATVITWLGTQGGKVFLSDCERRIAKEKAAQHAEFGRKYNGQ